MGRWTDRATQLRDPLEYSPVANSADSANSVEHDTPTIQPAPIDAGRKAANEANHPVPLIPGPGEEPFGAPQTNEGDDWRVWINERAAIREYVGEYETTEADHLAYSEAVEAWCSTHHKAPPPDRCAGCGTEIGEVGLSTGDGARVCDRPDFTCLIAYGTKRKRRAVNGFRAMGIEFPVGWSLPNGDVP